MSTSLREDRTPGRSAAPLPPAERNSGFYGIRRRAEILAMAAALATYRVVDGVMARPVSASAAPMHRRAALPR